MGFQEFAKSALASLKRNSPRILGGLSIGGFLATTILAVKATPEAMECIEEEKKRLNKRHLTPKETVKCTWKCYIWPAATAAASTGCALASMGVYEHINNNYERANAALATAVSIGDTIHREYRKVTEELVGTEKEKEIQDRVDEKQFRQEVESRQKDICEDNSLIESVKDGTTLCFFASLPLNRKMLYIDINKFNKAICKCNLRMSTSAEPYVSVADLLFEADVPYSAFRDNMDILERLGWNMYTGFIEIEDPDENEWETKATFDDVGTIGTVKCKRIKFTRAGSPRYDYQKS